MPQHCNQETSSSDCPTTPSKAPSCPNTEAPLLPLPVSHTLLPIDRSKFSMACIQDTSSDGSSKAASWPPAVAPALVPCCNGNCRLLGCPGTTNLCSKCYADSLRDEGTLARAQPLDGVSGMVPAIQSSDKPQESSFCADAIESTADVQDLKEEVPSPLRLSPPVLEQVEAAALLLPAPAPCEQIVKIVNRCLTCRKRVGLLGFKCKCGGVFCALHRYSDKHNCSFDYKAAGRVVIARENPVVIASKIEKI